MNNIQLITRSKEKKTNDNFNIRCLTFEKMLVPIFDSRRKTLREIEIYRNFIHMKKMSMPTKILNKVRNLTVMPTIISSV